MSNRWKRQKVAEKLDVPASLQLLRSAAAVTGAGALAAAHDDELLLICEVIGGNPLALWLVAGQAANIPWRTFMNDVVAWCPRGSSYELYDFLYRRSWEQLSADAKIVLFAMHRCAGGAPYDLLHALSALDQARFNVAVNDLRRRMLLMFGGAVHDPPLNVYLSARCHCGLVGMTQQAFLHAHALHMVHMPARHLRGELMIAPVAPYLLLAIVRSPEAVAARMLRSCGTLQCVEP